MYHDTLPPCIDNHQVELQCAIKTKLHTSCSLVVCVCVVYNTHIISLHFQLSIFWKLFGLDARKHTPRSVTSVTRGSVKRVKLLIPNAIFLFLEILFNTIYIFMQLL